MLFRLSTRNIRRSLRDYTVYFVTLLLAVTIFYAFNSVGDQQVMHDIDASNDMNIIEFTRYMMSVISVVVALVLGFLVIYANQLLIARRKHEFGLYLTLGMRPGQVSRILLYETVLVGLGSLVLGMLLGILVSQLLSFLTAALFGVAMPQYQFTFSPTAFVATLVCFVAIFAVVSVFNVVNVRRRKLIDLINDRAKSQRVLVRNPWLCLALFVLSLLCIAYAYEQLAENGMTLVPDDEFMRATVFMLAGSLLFFFSLSGFVLTILTRTRGVYLRKLRPFTTHQVASKVNTSFASIWIVCVLLFFAITTFATGMGFIDAFTGDINRANPYDASIILSSERTVYKDGKAVRTVVGKDITQTTELLSENVAGWDDVVAKSAQVDVYELPLVSYDDIVEQTGATLSNGATPPTLNVAVMGVTQYNGILGLTGQRPIVLGTDEYAVTNNMPISEAIADAMVAQRMPLATPAGDLLPIDHVEKTQLYDFDLLSNALTMVVPDDVIERLADQTAPSGAYLNIMFTSLPDAEDLFRERMEGVDVPGMTNMLTREQMVGQASGLRVMIAYLAIYIGLVLLIATAAVLAIQLLSLTIDSLDRYRMLSRLGCDGSMLRRSLFAQVCVYFAAPLGLAVCHSACAITILSNQLFAMMGRDLVPSIALSACLVLVVYGGYLLITYLASRETMRHVLV